MKSKIFLNSVLGCEPESSFRKQFKKEMELPFVPVPGQDLSPVVWIKFRIIEVTYDIQGQYVEVIANQDAGFDREGHDLEHITQAMVQAGWLEV